MRPMRQRSRATNAAAAATQLRVLLEAAGLVSGAPDPNDGRQTILSMTAACKERVKVGRMAWDNWLLEAIQKNLSPEEQAELERAIELLKRLVES